MTGEVAELVVEDDRLTGVRLADGEVVARQALVVAPALHRPVAASSPSLGLEAAAQVDGRRRRHLVPADPTGATAVPGVWVAGNVTDLLAQVIARPPPG